MNRFSSRQERGLPTRTPTTLRESSRRLQCHLILAEAATPPAEEDAANASPRTAGFEPKGTTPATKPNEPEPVLKAPEEAEQAQAAAPDGDGEASVHWAVAAERLAQEAVELAPGDPRPWQALAEACEAQGVERFSILCAFFGLLSVLSLCFWGTGLSAPDLLRPSLGYLSPVARSLFTICDPLENRSSWNLC